MHFLTVLSHKPCCWIFSLPVVWISSAYGQTTQPIVWGSNLSPGQVITSDGGAITLAEYTFELGSFGDFEPTDTNTSEWITHWKVFDAITQSDVDPRDGLANSGGASSFFAGNASLNQNRTSDSEDALADVTFGTGEQAYVFVRNGDTPEFGNEWLLYTSEIESEWAFPGGFSEHLIWSLGDADTVIWGAVNDTNVGAGEFTDTSSDFFIRTQGFASVPEPSTACLFGLAAFFACLRKRR